MKTFLFVVIFLIFAGCAQKSADVKVSMKNFGDETMRLISNKHYTLSCNDAKFMGSVFAADNFTVIAFTVGMAMDYMTNKGISKEDQNRLDDYAKLLDKLTVKLESKYKNDARTMDLIMKNLFSKDIDNMMEAAIAAYLNFVRPRDFDEFIDITFCGGKASATYKTPLNTTKEDLRKALMKKFGQKESDIKKK